MLKLTENQSPSPQLRTQQVVTRVLAEVLPPTETIREVLQSLLTTEGWEFAAYWEPDSDQEFLRCSLTQAPGNDWDRHRLRLQASAPRRGEELVGQAWSRMAPLGETLKTNPATFPDRFAAQVPDGAWAWAFPVVHANEVLGIIEGLSSAPPSDTAGPFWTELGQVLGRYLSRRQVSGDSAGLVTELERRLQDRSEALKEATRELESFSYSVSHDLRSPLRAIDGFSQALVEDFAAQLPEEARRDLDIIRAETRRMGQLIDDLLTFSRLSRAPFNPQPVDMTGLAQSALGEATRAHPERAQFVRLPALPPAHGDAALLRQVWFQLLTNALKFSGRQNPPVILIRAETRGPQVVYSVRDNGVGFDMQYAHKLFGVFQRLHRAEEFPGTGVGLAITQRIIHRHGGKIWAEAAPNQGATFFFTVNPGSPS